MAPELIGGKEPYNGPAVDIFACGAILFILKFARFGFSQSNDAYYRRLQRDPVKAMHDRNIAIKEEDKVFLDLVVGLTKEDPEKRLSLDQVRAHPWMKGEMVSADDVRNHFYSLVPGR